MAFGSPQKSFKQLQGSNVPKKTAMTRQAQGFARRLAMLRRRVRVCAEGLPAPSPVGCFGRKVLGCILVAMIFFQGIFSHGKIFPWVGRLRFFSRKTTVYRNPKRKPDGQTSIFRGQLLNFGGGPSSKMSVKRPLSQKLQT